MKLYTLGSSYSISIVFEAKLMESGKWRSAVYTETLPVNLPVKLVQVLNLIKENPHISYQ